jgi:hypothetical protein
MAKVPARRVDRAGSESECPLVTSPLQRKLSVRELMWLTDEDARRPCCGRWATDGETFGTKVEVVLLMVTRLHPKYAISTSIDRDPTFDKLRLSSVPRDPPVHPTRHKSPGSCHRRTWRYPVLGIRLGVFAFGSGRRPFDLDLSFISFDNQTPPDALLVFFTSSVLICPSWSPHPASSLLEATSR